MNKNPYKYNPDKEPHANLVEKALNSEIVKEPMESEKRGEYIRQRLTMIFTSIASDYERLEIPFIKPIPHLIKEKGIFIILIDKTDRRIK